MKYFKYVLTIALIISCFLPSLVFAESITTGVVSAELSLRIRSGPGTNYDQIGSLSYLSKVTILSYHDSGNGCDDRWVKIKTAGGVQGYVCSTYLKDIETHEATEEEANNNVDTSISQTGATMAAMTAEEFEQYLTSQGFPEAYKVKLRELHALHPTWIFKGVKSKYTWTSALNQQDESGTSLLNVNATGVANGLEGYLSTAAPDYDHINNKFLKHDGTYWFQANRQTIAYYMDPRNFLDEKRIFMFEELYYYPSYQKEELVKNVLSSNFLKQFSPYFMEASAASGVSPIFLASLVKQEVGTSTTNICTNGNAGVLSDGVDYTGYYNFFNIGASSSNNPKLKSLQHAKEVGWNTPQKAIVEGSQVISNYYVKCGQYTSYFQKFNVAPTATKGIWHQYTTNVDALSSPARSSYNAYNAYSLIEKDFVFTIPYFDGMPDSTSLPSLGNPNNWLKELKVNGSLVTNFDPDNTYYEVNVPYSETITVSATPIASTSTITTGIGTIQLTGATTSVGVNVKAQNGVLRTYTMIIKRADPPTPPTPTTPTVPDTPTNDDNNNNNNNNNNNTTPPTDNNDNNNNQSGNENNNTTPATPTETVNLNDVLTKSVFKYNDTYLWNVTLGSTVSSVTTELTKTYNTITVNIYDKNNNPKSQGRIVTGDKVVLSSNGKTKSLNVVIFGDIDGSGTISAVDLLHIQKHILGYTKLTGSTFMAADINKDNKISAIDLLQVQKHILNYANISQG